MDAVSDPLYQVAHRFLVEHELGIAPAREDLDARTIEAIRFVSGEMNRQREEIQRALKEKPGFRDSSGAQRETG